MKESHSSSDTACDSKALGSVFGTQGLVGHFQGTEGSVFSTSCWISVHPLEDAGDVAVPTWKQAQDKGQLVMPSSNRADTRRVIAMAFHVCSSQDAVPLPGSSVV